MKTKIITLESHDDLISVREKLSWAKTPRILLVWTKYVNVNLRILDLKVLQRHADSLGAQLGIVTRRIKVRRDAESLGIPVFKSTTEAQRKAWNQPAPRKQIIPKTPRRDLRALRDSVYQKESAWRTSLPGRIIAFTFGVLAVLAVAIIFIPRAHVIVYPETKTEAVTILVSASKTNESVSITGAIPARTISAVLQSEQTLAITTSITIPKTKAEGVARFTNLSQKEMTIPKGTIISTADEPAIRFVTLQETLFPVSNKFVDVKIESLELGEAANVGADEIKAVEGLLGFSLAVTNPNPTSGGADMQQVGASEDDRAKLRDTTLGNLQREADSKLRAQINLDDILLTDTIEILEIAEETFTPAAGEPSKTLTLVMQVEFSARYISADDLRELARAALETSAPSAYSITGGTSFAVRGEPKVDSAGAAHFEIEALRPLKRNLDLIQIRSLLRGDVASAKENLQKEISLRQDSEITVMPAWWKWMPLIPFNITVEVK